MRVAAVAEAVLPTVRFVTTDGERRKVDATPLIKGPWHGELADPAYFSQARPCDSGWAIGWPNGQAIAPDDLAELSVPDLDDEDADDLEAWREAMAEFDANPVAYTLDEVERLLGLREGCGEDGADRN